MLCTMSSSWMQNSCDHKDTDLSLWQRRFNNLEMINAMDYQAPYSLVILIWEEEFLYL